MSNESLKSQLSNEVQHSSVSILFLELLAKMCGAVKLNYCNKCNKLTNFRIPVLPRISTVFDSVQRCTLRQMKA